MNSTATTASTAKKPLYARTVADALEKHLGSLPDSSVYWAVVAGEEKSYGPPKMIWPDSPNLGYYFDHGSNEGTILTVMHQPGPYDREKLVPLIAVKFLREMKSVLREAADAIAFLDDLTVPHLLEWQKSRHKGAAIAA